MKNLVNILSAIALLQLTACASLFPYEDKFACERPDNLGKCVSPSEAYEEITTGKSAGKYMKPHSEQNDSDEEEFDEVQVLRDQLANEYGDGYDRYLDANYSEVAALIDEPVTPLVKPVMTAEMLIMPYSDSAKVLKGERYINIIVEDPTFVLGNYLKKKTLTVPSLFTEQQ